MIASGQCGLKQRSIKQLIYIYIIIHTAELNKIYQTMANGAEKGLVQI